MKVYVIYFINGSKKIRQLTERQADRLARVYTVASIQEMEKTANSINYKNI